MTFHPNAERERPSAWVGIIFLLSFFLILSGATLLAVHVTRGIMP